MTHGGTLRVLRCGALHPCMNMGLDEALLREPASPPTLRLYRWQPAGLSIGYFQRAEDFSTVAGEHVLVRRVTGGGAIYHGDEITFSLALDACRLPERISESYDLIHESIRLALIDVGVLAHRRGAGRAQPRKQITYSARPDRPWCFADPVCEDLLTEDGRKILGSAQRRIRTPTDGIERVLHHGSLVLTPPKATPFCGSVAATVDPRRVEAELQAAIVSHLGHALALQPIPGSISHEEQLRAESLAAQRYSDPAFTMRR